MILNLRRAFRLRKEGLPEIRSQRGIPETEAVHRFPNISLNFQEAYTVGEQLWALGEVLQNDPRYAKPPNWALTFRYAIRGMVARIITVDRDYRGLNEPGDGTATDEDMTTQDARNWWNTVWESYAGTLFFAMDSSLECFTHALNALGYLLHFPRLHPIYSPPTGPFVVGRPCESSDLTPCDCCWLQ